MKNNLINYFITFLFRFFKVTYEDKNLIKMLRTNRYFCNSRKQRLDQYVFHFKKWWLNFSVTYDDNEKDNFFHFLKYKFVFFMSMTNKEKIKYIISNNKELCLNEIQKKKEYSVKSVTEIIKKMNSL